MKPNLMMAAVGAALLGGCAGVPSNSGPTPLDQSVGRVEQLARQAMPSGSAIPPTNGGIVVRRVSAPAPPPSWYFDSATLNRGDIETASELTRRLMNVVGMPVRLSREVEDYIIDRNKRQRSDRPTVVNAGSGNVSMVGDEPSIYNLSYSGTKKGLLDAVAGRIGCSWRSDSGTIVFYLTDTRTFYIRSLPGETKATSTVTSDASSSGARSDIEVSSNQTIWKGIDQTLRSMISATGKLSVSPSNGTVTVTDIPDVLDRVTKYIEEQNRFLNRQVALEVKVFTVALTDNSQFGLDLNIVAQSLSGSYGFSAVANTATAVNGALMSLSVLQTATGAAAKFAGSQALFGAIAKQGKVSASRSTTLTTVNNQSVPFRVGRKFAYLASVTSSATANVGSSTSLTPGQGSEGFTVDLLPSIQEDGSILLQMTMDYTTLREIRVFASGNNRVELPDYDTSNFIQRASLRNGETLILSGFEQNIMNQDNTTGILNFGRGGGQGKQIQVVMVTPVITGGR